MNQALAWLSHELGHCRLCAAQSHSHIDEFFACSLPLWLTASLRAWQPARHTTPHDQGFQPVSVALRACLGACLPCASERPTRASTYTARTRVIHGCLRSTMLHIINSSLHELLIIVNMTTSSWYSNLAKHLTIVTQQLHMRSIARHTCVNACASHEYRVDVKHMSSCMPIHVHHEPANALMM